MTAAAIFKKGLIAAIGQANYIHYVTFITDLYQSAYAPDYSNFIGSIGFRCSSSCPSK